jgi:hypothetical protein
MKIFDVTQFDGSTYVVFEQGEQQEVCICGNHDNREDAEDRAHKIAFLLNTLELLIQKNAKLFMNQ